ncbi:type II toxin-antitoxin system RelE/ParE family toxin [Methylobacterium phyllosphaerae]
MPWDVRISRAAAADLMAAREWLRQPGAGGKAAERLTQIGRALRALRHDPLLWPEGEHPGTRSRSVAGYRIIYAITGHEAARAVIVLRVFGPGQRRDRL